MMTLEGFSETWLLKHLSNHIFCSLYFRNCASCQGHLCIQNVQNLMQNSEKQQQNQKKIVVSQVIAFELVAVNSLCYKENTCHP